MLRFVIAALLFLSVSVSAQKPFPIVEATIPEMQAALKEGASISTARVRRWRSSRGVGMGMNVIQAFAEILSLES